MSVSLICINVHTYIVGMGDIGILILRLLQNITIIMIIVLSAFALDTVYKCINLSIFVPNHCKPCHDKERL